MTWIYVALMEAAIMGVVNVIDSHLVTKRMPSLWAFFIPLGTIHLTFGVILLQPYPLPCGVEVFPWLIVAASALTRTAAIFLMFWAMRTEEVSRVIPVVYTFPVFVAIMAVPLLGEALGPLQWLAVVMTAAGAVLISMKEWRWGRGALLRRSFFLLLVSSILLGASNTAAKYALEHVSFWNMYSINAISYGVVFCLVSLRPSVVAELRNMERRAAALGIMAFNETLTLVGIVLSFWAIQNGPVSLVSTIMGARPFFVFLYALVLGLVLPTVLIERMGRGTVILKLASIALIVGGVAIINLAAGTDS